jgi:tetratricopeptide (TPR) repeat protein
MAAKSRTLNIDWRYSWTETREKALDSALYLAQSAIEVDPTDARGFGELGFAHLYRKEHDAALSAYRRALGLNPNDADLMSDMADALAHSGEAAQAVALLDKAKRLNPFYPDQYLWHLGGAYYKLGHYEDAVHTINSMQNPTEGRRILAASYAQLGRLVEARREATKIREAHPTFSVERWAAVQPDRLESDTMHFVEGLRKAGL